MKIVLVNPPKSVFDLEELAPPLGLYKLAHIAAAVGHSTYVEDYNLLWHLDPRLRIDFYSIATERLLDLDADVYGFTSMAVDSHVALEMARRLKERRSTIRIVLGGSHFSAIAPGIAERFNWVDSVICGEGEVKFREALCRLDGKAPTGSEAAASECLAYETGVLAPYFHVNPRQMVNFEAGRGCRFKCSFCYSPSQYDGGFRMFPIGDTVSALSRLPALGVRHIWFVEDNFLNDPLSARRLCSALKEAQLGLSWSCYATWPEITEDLAIAMAKAGCTEIFTGIDAVGKESQRVFRKAFLKDPQSLQYKLAAVRDVGIQLTCAFLLSPPSYPGGSDVNATVATALDAQIGGSEVLLNPLTLYPRTGALCAVPVRLEHDQMQADWMMDVPDLVVENELASISPSLFPFHSRYVARDEWHSFLRDVHCLATLIHTYPKTLRQLQTSKNIDPLDVARATVGRFSEWDALSKLERRPMEQDIGFLLLEELAAGSFAAKFLEEERPAIRSCA